MLLMRGLAKLSQAVVETQSNTLRTGSGQSVGFWESGVNRLFTLLEPLFNIPNAGIPGVGAAVQGVQSAAEQGLSAAMMKMQVCINQTVHV